MKNKKKNRLTNRREFIRSSLHTAAGIALGGIAGILLTRSASSEKVWQLDPNICMQCEKCSQNCVLPQSAVKVVHSFSMCGYCDLCSGYLQPGARARNTGAESQLCPTGAIKRTFVEEPYFQYTIDENLCIGCGKCVKGCDAFGNGSMYLQVKHDLCVNCNECSIARSCPSGAYKRVDASRPYILRGDEASRYKGKK